MRKLSLLGCVAAACALAQQPQIQNAKTETRQVTGSVEATMKSIVAAQSAPAWIGYAVPIVKGDRNMCCYSNNNAGCFLEGRNQMEGGIRSGDTIKLEGPTHLVVLYRIEDHAIGKVRTFTPECGLDAGGLPFIWFNGVQPAESVHYLTSLVTPEGGVRRSPVSAIALHADPAADQALEQLTAASSPESVRRDAAFWLGNARGRRGFEILSRMLRDDPSDKVREQSIFALTQSKEPEALNLMIKTAHDDKSTHVRGQALFWLAHKAGDKVTAAIQNAVDNDPDTEVKKKAVFALTQLPNHEGTPLLIQVARTNRNPAVRKQAIFWLGQSKDPRALSFLEDVLLGKM